MLLDNLQLFLVIAEKGSLVAAGRETGLSSTTVSDRLAALERHYGVVLFNRTTRSISLTEEGRTLLDGARNLLNDVSDLDALIRHGAQTLSGQVRVSAPNDLGRGLISTAIVDFVRENPRVSVDLSLSDGYVDLIGQGFDLAVRFGRIGDTSLRARRLGDFQRFICASPSYMAAHGEPKTPAELATHNCLVMRFGDVLDNVWRFQVDGRSHQVRVRGNLVADDGYLIRAWALQGRGIVLKSELDVGDDIRDGKLVKLLGAYYPPPTPLQMLFPPSRAQPRRVQALADRISALVGGGER